MSKLGKAMGAEEIFATQTKINNENSWLRYGIPAGLILLSVAIAYGVTKNKKNDGKKSNQSS